MFNLAAENSDETFCPLENGLRFCGKNCLFILAFLLFLTAAHAAPPTTLHDDGAVVYLNCAEAFRSNMQTNSPVMFNSPACSKIIGIDQTLHYFTASVPAALLLAGTNVLAVEVRHFQASGGDLNFNLAMDRLSSTNLNLVSQWSVLETNQFDATGALRVSNALVPGTPLQFFLLKEPCKLSTAS